MSYSTQVLIKGPPRQVFEAIAHHVQQWWGYTDLPVRGVGDVFTTRFDTTFWKFEVSTFEPHSHIIWHCIEARHIHKGYEGIETEWIGTSVEWKLEAVGEQDTLLHFLHNGLVSELNCYEICYPAWEYFVTQSLKQFVETGKGMPALG